LSGIRIFFSDPGTHFFQKNPKSKIYYAKWTFWRIEVVNGKKFICFCIFRVYFGTCQSNSVQFCCQIEAKIHQCSGLFTVCPAIASPSVALRFLSPSLPKLEGTWISVSNSALKSQYRNQYNTGFSDLNTGIFRYWGFFTKYTLTPKEKWVFWCQNCRLTRLIYVYTFILNEILTY
jgi:hypothetical protein